MKKILGALLFVIVIACAGYTETEAAELKDFASWEAPAFYNADGTAKTINLYRYEEVQDPYYGKMTKGVNVGTTTTVQLFNENLVVPDAMVAAFNKSGGRLRIVEKPFSFDQWAAGYEYHGLSKPRFENGRTVWDIEIYIFTNSLYTLESECKTAAETAAHELGHILKFSTQDRWTQADWAEYNRIISEEKTLATAFANSPMENVYVEEEMFATIVEYTYRSDSPQTKYKEFVDRIISYTRE